MKKSTKAGKIAELAKQLGGIFVLSTRDTSIPTLENASAEIAKYPFAEFACNSCGTHFTNVQTAGLDHHCVHCGSDDTEKVADDVTPNIPKDEEATYQTCSSCGTTSIVHASLASLEHIHCSACGTQMSLSAEDEGVVELDDMEVLDVDAEEDSILDLDTAPNELDDMEGTDETLVTENPETSTDDTTDDMTDAVTDVPPLLTDTNADDTAMKVYSEEMEVDLTEGVDDNDDSLEFSSLNKNVVILKDNQVIACLSEENAGVNADIMHTAAFEEALKHTLSTQGLKKVLSSYKFVSNKVTVKVPNLVKAKVEEASKAKDTLVTAKIESLAVDFEQSLMIAALGLSRNVFKNRQDPVKAALITELVTLGVKNPSKVIDGVFAAHGVSQVNEIISLAKELAHKDVAARNALSDVIDLTKYTSFVKASDEADDDKEEDEDDEVATAQVQSFAKPVVASVKDQPKSKLYRSSALASIMGNTPVFN